MPTMRRNIPVVRGTLKHLALTALATHPDGRCTPDELRAKLLRAQNHNRRRIPEAVNDLIDLGLAQANDEYISITIRGRDVVHALSGDVPAAATGPIVPPRTTNRLAGLAPPDRPTALRPGANDFRAAPSRQGARLVFDHAG